MLNINNLWYMLTFQNISNGKKYLGCIIRKIKKQLREVGNWSLAIEPLVLMVPSIHYILVLSIWGSTNSCYCRLLTSDCLLLVFESRHPIGSPHFSCFLFIVTIQTLWFLPFFSWHLSCLRLSSCSWLHAMNVRH